MEKNACKKRQPITPTGNAKGTPLLHGKPIAVTNIRTAKRLLSRLILAFQKGEANGRDAKDLCYLVSIYVQIAKDTELEERLIKLEEKLGGNNGDHY